MSQYDLKGWGLSNLKGGVPVLSSEWGDCSWEDQVLESDRPDLELSVTRPRGGGKKAGRHRSVGFQREV